MSWTFFGLFLSLYGTLVLPWLADQAPSGVAADAPTPEGVVLSFALGLLTWLLGAALLAAPFVGGRVRPRWVGYLLPASALWVAVGNFVIVPGGPASNLAVNLLANLGPVLLLIGFGYLGFRAWAERAPAEHVGQGADGQPGRGGRPSLGVGAGRTAAESVRRDRKNTLFRGSTMGLRRWFYAGGRPKLMARLLDRGTAAVSARGVGPEYLVALEVPGRRSERSVSLTLVVATVGGERYLVSMLGEGVNWVRNVRAAGGDAALRHGCREEVHLQEVVAPDLRAPVLKAYLKRAINANAHMPIDKDAPLAEFERLPLRFPVFRIVTRSNG